MFKIRIRVFHINFHLFLSDYSSLFDCISLTLFFVLLSYLYYYIYFGKRHMIPIRHIVHFDRLLWYKLGYIKQIKWKLTVHLFLKIKILNFFKILVFNKYSTCHLFYYLFYIFFTNFTISSLKKDHHILQYFKVTIPFCVFHAHGIICCYVLDHFTLRRFSS